MRRSRSRWSCWLWVCWPLWFRTRAPSSPGRASCRPWMRRRGQRWSTAWSRWSIRCTCWPNRPNASWRAGGRTSPMATTTRSPTRSNWPESWPRTPRTSTTTGTSASWPCCRWPRRSPRRTWMRTRPRPSGNYDATAPRTGAFARWRSCPAAWATYASTASPTATRPSLRPWRP